MNWLGFSVCAEWIVGLLSIGFRCIKWIQLHILAVKILFHFNTNTHASSSSNFMLMLFLSSVLAAINNGHRKKNCCWFFVYFQSSDENCTAQINFRLHNVHIFIGNIFDLIRVSLKWWPSYYVAYYSVITQNPINPSEINWSLWIILNRREHSKHFEKKAAFHNYIWVDSKWPPISYIRTYRIKLRFFPHRQSKWRRTLFLVLFNQSIEWKSSFFQCIWLEHHFHYDMYSTNIIFS